MNSRPEQVSRFNIAGLATGSILALVLTMAASLVFDIQPAEAKSPTRTAHTTITAHA